MAVGKPIVDAVLRMGAALALHGIRDAEAISLRVSEPVLRALATECGAEAEWFEVHTAVGRIEIRGLE
jgi:hypothetical protein